MTPVECYIGLGSNLGEREQHLHFALTELVALPDTQITSVSRLYLTAPMGPQDQPDYLNAVTGIITSLSAPALLDALKHIETRAGRTPGRRWGERVLDLDILHHGDTQLASPALTIPHVGIAERAFVLVPLQDIAPQLVLADGRPVASLYEACEKDSVRYHGDLGWGTSD